MVTIALQRPPIGAAWLGVPDWQTDTLIILGMLLVIAEVLELSAFFFNTSRPAMDDFVRRKHKKEEERRTSRDPSKTRPPSLWGRLKRRVKLAWSVSRPAIIELIHESWTRLTLSKMTSLVLAGLFVFFSPETGAPPPSAPRALSVRGGRRAGRVARSDVAVGLFVLWLPRRDARAADALRGQVDLPDGGLQNAHEGHRAAVALRLRAVHPDVLGLILGGHSLRIGVAERRLLARPRLRRHHHRADAPVVLVARPFRLRASRCRSTGLGRSTFVASGARRRWR